MNEVEGGVSEEEPVSEVWNTVWALNIQWNILVCGFSTPFPLCIYFSFCPGYKDMLCVRKFPGSSDGKESACNAEDPGLIPGSGRSLGEGTGYPPQYSWASLVARMVKNLLTMWETWVRSLGLEDPLEKGMATHSNILAWRIPCTEEPGRLQSMGLQKVRHNWAINTCAWHYALCWGYSGEQVDMIFLRSFCSTREVKTVNKK